MRVKWPRERTFARLRRSHLALKKARVELRRTYAGLNKPIAGLTRTFVGLSGPSFRSKSPFLAKKTLRRFERVMCCSEKVLRLHSG